MGHTGTVMKHEIASMLSKRSWWFFTFLFPAFIMAVSFLPQMAAQRSFREMEDLAGEIFAPIAIVDLAGAAEQLPPEIAAGSVLRFASEAKAEAAVTAGEIEQYYLIPEDFSRSGEVTAVSEHANPISGLGHSSRLEYILRFNAVGDARVAALLEDPTPIGRSVGLETGTEAPPEITFIGLPWAVMFLLFLVITMSAGYMLQSVAQEKENRTAEVLLTSVQPRQLMIGKVAGLGLIALLQMTIWGLGGMLALGGSAAFGAASLASGSGEQLAALSTMAAAAGELQPSADVEFQAALAGGAPAVQAALGAASAALPGGSVQGALIFFGWTIVFFILGYLAYACALAALGALAPNMREGSQYTFFLLLPLMVPLWFSQVFVTDPHGVAATAFSLTPLTSPTSMVTRMAAGGVPTWQPVLAALLLAATCYLFVILAARFFRADTLLSAEALTWRRLRNELLPNRR